MAVPTSTLAYSPAAQYEQRETPYAGVTEPRGQISHADCPTVDDEPGGQALHVDCPAAAVKKPRGQFLQSPEASASAYCPALHVPHELDAGAEVWPIGHCVQDAWP
mmetsp:Transcript_17007/g.50987  ORF Transcript_17007/g.50987 Transcript_17007/m.50987 type:complete len:106 (+) Transcript_17007:1101-1418(+)